MKSKLEAIANVTVIVVALVAGYTVLKGQVARHHLPKSVAAGDYLGQVPGIDWSRHRRTLVLALNSDCHFCQESAPFYQRLAQAQPRGAQDVGIVAVFPNDPEAVRQVINDEGLSVRSIATVPLEKLGVAGTPTLILVDSRGRVERTWFGLLTAREEVEVMSVVYGGSEDSSASERPPFQVDGNKSSTSGTNEQAEN